MPNALKQYAEARPTPRNKLMGLLANTLTQANEFATLMDPRYENKRQNQTLGLLADAVSLGSLAKTADRMSYGEPLTNAGKANVPFMKPETADALMMAPLSPRNALAALGMVGGVADDASMRAMMLYHGSKKPLAGGVFDLSKVGSGTGANTEGWGAYYSLDKRNAEKFGKHINVVDIPDDIAAKLLLDWDKPINKQSDKIKSVAALYEKDISDPAASAATFFRWANSLAPMDRANRDMARRLMPAIYQEAGKAKVNFETFARIAKEIAPLNPNYVYQNTIGSSIKTGDDLQRIVLNDSARNNKSASNVFRGYGIAGHIFDASRDLHSVVPNSRNVVLYDQDVIDAYTVRSR